MLFSIQLVQDYAIAFCIITDTVNKGWVGILVVGDVNLSSALYASGDGGEILVRSEGEGEGEREWQCGRYAYLEQSGYFLHAFLVLKPWSYGVNGGLLPRGLLLLLCVTRACYLN